ncbi:hypothetical protein JTB14_024232 [Gonioctena quinquepunctata]|nr:hypothetical protein JTB14_024232 [Gonioctena quinquepunctata]
MIQKSKREDQPKPVSPRKNRDGKISNRKTEKENKTYAASCEALRNIHSLTDVELKEDDIFENIEINTTKIVKESHRNDPTTCPEVVCIEVRQCECGSERFCVFNCLGLSCLQANQHNILCAG